jgi:hypothetical protein
MVERLIFGDNQFFGVNHMSEEKSQQQLMKFNSVDSMVDTLRIAYDAGIRGFMLHSHALAGEFCSKLRADAGYWQDLVLYPAIPHPVKYMNSVAEKGVHKTLVDALREGSDIRRTIMSIARGGVGFLTKDVRKLATSLIDIEMRPYKGLKIGAIFLHNIAVDLLLGLGVSDVYPHVRDHVEREYGAELGLISLNLPLIVESLESVGMARPLIMSSFNKIGYYMNPSKGACEDVVRSGRVRLVAMSVLASGAVPPSEAIEYVSGFAVESLIYGASSRQHICQTKEIIDKAIPAH